MKVNSGLKDEARNSLLKTQYNGKIIFDMATVTGIQLLTEDLRLINTDVDNISSIEVNNPVSAWPDHEPSKATERDYEVASAKIVIKDIKTKLFDPITKKQSKNSTKRAYERFISKNIYGISVAVEDEWKSYYFSPNFWFEDEKDKNIAINPRVKLELNGDGATIIALDENEEEWAIIQEEFDKYEHETYGSQEKCLSLIKDDSIEFCNIPDKYKTYEICLQACQQNYMLMQFVPEKMLTKDLCLNIVKNANNAIEFVPDNIKSEIMQILGLHNE